MDDNPGGGCIGCIFWVLMWAVIIWAVQACLNAGGVL
jgi:hypothetical protein